MDLKLQYCCEEISAHESAIDLCVSVCAFYCQSKWQSIHEKIDRENILLAKNEKNVNEID